MSALYRKYRPQDLSEVVGQRHVVRTLGNAIQAGRELRVIVDAENVSDDRAAELSFEISQKIEKEMQYPGQIKVTVIREMRSVAYAK